LPGRQHLDPLELPKLLPNIWMLDIHRDPYRFRVRLSGTAIVEFTKRDVTGRWLHDVYPDFENTDAYRCIRACAESGKPAFRRSNIISNPEQEFVEAERIYLPLASNGRQADILFNMTQYLLSG